MKLLQWFVKMVLTVVLISALTLLTTGLIVQSYAKSLLASFNIQWEGQPLGLAAMFQGMIGGKSGEDKKTEIEPPDQPTGAEEEQVPENATSVMGNGTDDDPGSTERDTEVSLGGDQPNTSTGSGSGESSGNESNSDESSGVGGTTGGSVGSTGEGVASGNGTGGSSNGTAPTGNDAIVVSPDDITGVKDKLPLEDKEKIFSLLMAKLPQKEMQQISGAMEGGLTEQELREIEQVISKYLTSEEYDNLMEVLQAE
ncbi:hypothetical protein ASD24_27960 [Paenibacillus sp. Root52]|uniref:hypothetical protein n=1 Tax=Paenibacillus sp. Root52 TaxID=1736552 RepID=UPI0006FE84E7|nr:hypothetical protein [Paenibacillus sp. Root52]KQY85911.1 hypothetical protein ASD24_27960 [Paenibacillus sp. Root52]